MARKAVNGYPEKSYYDNTLFGGIVATGDPLNEGSFALITNFDITDTSKSVTPRKGFLSTTFTDEDAHNIVLSDKILMYRDPNIQKHIVLDLNYVYATELDAYIVDLTSYNIENNLISNATRIKNFDIDDVTNFISKFDDDLKDDLAPFEFIIQNSKIIGDTQLKPIRDLDGVTYYITKLEYTRKAANNNGDDITIPFWIKVMYRPNATTVGENTYLGDTLIVSVIDMTQQTTNFLNRNIASEVPIIPNPIRSQEEVGTEDTQVTDVNRPLLLETPKGYATKNLDNSFKDSLDVRIDPTFHLQDPSAILGSADGKWAYRFDIVSTDTTTDYVRYKSPWRTLEVSETEAGENSIISELSLYNKEGVNLPTYTYFVVAPYGNDYNSYDLTETNKTSYVTYEQAEGRLYNAMRFNGEVGTKGNTLGNLATAYARSKSMANAIPKDVQLEKIDGSLFNSRGYHFITEDDMRSKINPTLDLYADCIDRKANYTQSGILDNGYVVGSTNPISAPLIPLTYTNYSNLTQLSFDDFIKHATRKIVNYKIQVVFLPFIYRRAGEVSGEAFDAVYLTSVSGIYINGMNIDSDSLPHDVASYDDIASLRKKAEIYTSKNNVSVFVNIFDDLSNLKISDTLSVIPRAVYNKGVTAILYLKPYNQAMLEEYIDTTVAELEALNASWDSSSFIQTAIAVWSNPRDVVYIEETDLENPRLIADAEGYLVFEDRLVLWKGNKVFISEEGQYYYFTNILKKEFPEEILKVITFKTILLVFTTQNLYAIHRIEVDTATGTFTEEGVAEMTTDIVWIQQPVLYNINPERKYLDVIQVYNQMILFYSNEGQLYMIKPSTMIDSETQFGIQYFNKSANDILANYHDYINMRLKLYGKLDVEDPDDYITKDDVTIHSLIDIDNIKIFYTVPKKNITFILIYDVVNNRYTTQDTLSFNNITSVLHIEGGELYVTKNNSNTYFTLPYIGKNNVDQNVDMHYARAFKKNPVFAYIDTGNLNLNNHIGKRMRDLKIVLKNIDATKILYNAELLLDDAVIRPFYAPDFNVKMVNGPDTRMIVEPAPVEDMNELFGLDQTIGVDGNRNDIHSYYIHDDNNFFKQHSLLKTETLNSSKLIEYNSSILSMGKVVRLRLQFISKGRYKLQSFGIVYKERHV